MKAWANDYGDIPRWWRLISPPPYWSIPQRARARAMVAIAFGLGAGAGMW